MPETKRTFENDDDLFHRKPYAEFLRKLILNCDNYHRDDDVKAYAIALDSPWGTGKSVFLEKFESMLEQDCKDQLCVVHYNAWENDFWDNAFEPFADAIFSHPLFSSPLADQTEEQAIVKIGSAVKHLAVAFTKKRLENYFDSEHLAEAGTALASAVGTYVSSDPTSITPAYSAYKKNIKDMQDAMGTVLQEAIPGGKLVIIIDELDRCRPTFAIETLEIVKHVMDVPNTVFLFALDLQQLGLAVKQIYGFETDSTGYLMRFFSYYSRLPEIDPDALLKNCFKKDEFFQFNAKLFESFVSISRALQLSARDIETVSNVYQLMELSFLYHYKSPIAYTLYWLLLCAKYKDPISFNNVLSTGTQSEDENSWDRKNFGDIFSVVLDKILDNKPLKRTLFNVYTVDSRTGTSRLKKKDIRIYATRSRSSSILIQCMQESSSEREPTCIVQDTDTLSGFLFYSDLLYWNETKNLTPGQFLLKRLEMFNFIQKPSK